SILFTRAEIEVHLAATATVASDAEQVIEEIVAKMTEALGPALFATNGETMEEVIGTLLTDRGETLAVAESCTGGLIGMRLTEIPGSSKYFLEGAITYSNDAKTRTLDVSAETLNEYGAVSSQTAEAMAAGVRLRAGSSYGISVTGVAGPDGGSEEKPVGTVFIGYSDSSRTKSIKFTFPGDRHLIRWRSSQAALDYLRRQIVRLHEG
ncbi:MAG TPA: nicotinamide-nucleotide amidohydrolase family protein, partial [Pyrinomonadaceae bacterium]|nr:nicotinamide-nucleotide amidohydrolase family protein [Pyrinomonadaceae bacterium]